jgi:hypothetical protein
MSRPLRRLAPCAAAVATAAAIALPASAGAASPCTLSLKAAQHMGPTYVTKLRASGTSCANAIKITKAFHACRLKHGKRGRCTTKVSGYSCSDRRPKDEMIPTQFTGHVTCRKGGARITHDYQQNT